MSTHLDNFNFDDLPDVDVDASVADTVRVPRFDGDVSELSNQACWALQNLLTRRYLTKQDSPERWAWLLEHRKVLASRLCELDLRLRIHDDLEVAYAEPALLDSPNQHSRRVLRREPMGTYASIVALHLAKIMRTSHDEHVLISKADIHDLFGNVRHRVDRDEAMLRNRIDEAITRLVKTQILLRTRDDDDTYAISPVILAIMTGQMVDELSKEFEQLLTRGADPDAAETAADGEDTLIDDGEGRDDDG
ncbi:hypothetical protein MRAB57_1506 [Mycobacterium rhizamassiliense]|jgi:hypothetical protein|uniref:DUF4194 domain-containing protein n=1 Tax=Mycobacterium rhizamassiliense TaxID=1841860 RepID=A0A2U3NQB9_9MYCO|nr:DUF4194 domain-containing protein [Mycobacterium rhizamassiliense]SPM33702.1 hypothetical protein MRAB57_1506 [Mycobacterium rhizamassiliense]